MMFRRARASVLLLWLVACGGGGSEPADPCAASGVCTTPPANGCQTDTTALRYPAAGTCSAAGGQASCDYQPTVVDCGATGQVCRSGACVSDACAIPADGAGFLAYADDRTGDLEVRAIREDGTCDQPLGSGPGDDWAPSWSAAGGLVAWTARDGNLRIAVQVLHGGAPHLLDTGPELATSPALSPDGTLVAFERRGPSEATADVCVMPVTGGAPVPLAPDPANDAGPVFSFTARGNFLYFVSNRSGDHEVWRVAVDALGVETAAPEQVTSGSSVVGKPTVSADGRFLGYTTIVDTLSRVMIRDLTTGVETRLGGEVDSDPAFAGAGSPLIAVRTSRFGSDGGDVVLLDVQTGALVRRLTSGTATVGTPAFPR